MGLPHTSPESPPRALPVARLSYIDTASACTVVATTPAASPALWRRYLRGAQRSYRRFGVEEALEIDRIRGGDCTAAFFALVEPGGAVVGGVRVEGPLHSAGQSHAVAEWAERPGLETIRRRIAERLPGGVVEMKAAWVDAPGRGGQATAALARVAPHTLTLLGVRYAMATSAAYVLERWCSSGGAVDEAVPPTPYPDARYLTRIMWWDAATVPLRAEPAQALRIAEETRLITEAMRRGGHAPVRAARP